MGKGTLEFAYDDSGYVIAPWRLKFWFDTVKGNAFDVYCNQEKQSVSTYTTTQSIHVPGGFTTKLDYVMSGSISIPKQNVRVSTYTESSFWIRGENGDAHFQITGQIPQIANGHKVTVFFAGKNIKKKDKAAYIYVYNHSTSTGGPLVGFSKLFKLNMVTSDTIKTIWASAVLSLAAFFVCKQFELKSLSDFFLFFGLFSVLIGAIFVPLYNRKIMKKIISLSRFLESNLNKS